MTAEDSAGCAVQIWVESSDWNVIARLINAEQRSRAGVKDDPGWGHPAHESSHPHVAVRIPSMPAATMLEEWLLHNCEGNYRLLARRAKMVQHWRTDLWFWGVIVEFEEPGDAILLALSLTNDGMPPHMNCCCGATSPQAHDQHEKCS